MMIIIITQRHTKMNQICHKWNDGVKNGRNLARVLDFFGLIVNF